MGKCVVHPVPLPGQAGVAWTLLGEQVLDQTLNLPSGQDSTYIDLGMVGEELTGYLFIRVVVRGTASIQANSSYTGYLDLIVGEKGGTTSLGKTVGKSGGKYQWVEVPIYVETVLTRQTNESGFYTSESSSQISEFKLKNMVAYLRNCNVKLNATRQIWGGNFNF